MIFTANVRLLDPSEGGRTHPASQGYRPTVQFEGHKWLLASKITFLDDLGLPFAQGGVVPRVVRAEVRMPNSQLTGIDIKPGSRFWLTEGTHRVAECVVKDVIDTADYLLGT